ncbi:hypothetical protein [uncultured Sphingobium sp.]|uniref:hypothetical protein n=1 Tax=uncultured Sphingobium sp. TaxID=316087 RepID=UPI00259BCC66|nr:hypothetical protein [uncultured Sphingobium sp.]
MTSYATFNADGDCLSITGIKSGLTDALPVPSHTLPNGIWRDGDGIIVERQDVDVVPDVVAVGFVWNSPALDGTRVYVDGQPVAFPHVFGQPGQALVELRGRHRMMKFVAVNSYAEDRAAAYPSIEAQLDQLYHDGFEAWRATIADVKSRHPKPVQPKET